MIEGKLMSGAADIPDGPLTIPDFEIESLVRCLLPKIQAFFDTPEGQAAFEAWKRLQQDT